MTTKESKYHELLEMLGMTIDDRPSEVRTTMLDLPKLPDVPIFTVIVDEDTGEPEATLLVDEVGNLWVSLGAVNLSGLGFGNYFDFREQSKRNAKN